MLLNWFIALGGGRDLDNIGTSLFGITNIDGFIIADGI